MKIKQNNIKESRYVNHHMKNLCSIHKYQFITVIFPEGILFPSLSWKYTNEKYSIFIAITPLLLNLCWIKEGFSIIQKQNITRLTSTSNAMVYDFRYICHCYDIMANLSEFCNDTRFVINCRLTVCEDKHGNLGAGGSEDSLYIGFYR